MPGKKMSKYVVAEHPLMDTVLLGFGTDASNLEMAFALKPEDAIDIGRELIAIGQRVLEREITPVEPQDPNYQEVAGGD